MLYLVGLGLSGENDITLKGLNAIKKSEKLFMEIYTSILLGTNKIQLELIYEKNICFLNREGVEESDNYIEEAKTKDIALLVIGDPLAATTHSEIVMRCIENNVDYEIIHNASIVTAVADTGLQLYKFGEIVSIVSWSDIYKPTSYFDKIRSNLNLGLHTLCLLDIKIQEKSVENIIKNKPVYEPPYFMSVNECLSQLLEIAALKNDNIISNESPCFGLARMGSKDQIIVSGLIKELLNYDFGAEIHSLVLVGNMHELEEKFYKHFNIHNTL